MLTENDFAASATMLGCEVECIKSSRQIKDMMLEYPTLYTDISYALSDKDTHPAIFHDLKQPTIGTRIMYGTDFFLTERELPEKEDYNTFKQHALDPANAVKGVSAWDIIASRNVAAFLY